MKKIFSGYVKQGKLHLEESAEFADLIKGMEGQRLIVEIRDDRPPRSLNQNRLYWFYVNIISREIGYFPEEMHEILKSMWLRREVVLERTGEIVSYIPSTSHLTTKEFTDYIEKIRIWAGVEQGIYLPLPEEQFELFT